MCRRWDEQGGVAALAVERQALPLERQDVLLEPVAGGRVAGGLRLGQLRLLELEQLVQARPLQRQQALVERLAQRVLGLRAAGR